MLQRVNVVAIVKNKDKVLMLRRSIFNKLYQFQWQFPEGGIKFGESPEKALARELEEETGLKLKGARLLSVKSSTVRYLGHDFWHFIRIFYSCKISGKIKLGRAHDQYRWISKKEVSKMKLLKGFGVEDVRTLF